MDDYAIQVENLGKRYRIGQFVGYQTLRESFVNMFSASFRRSGRDVAESKNGQHIWSLKDISFKVKRGEAIGIIGRNGAGKTTLYVVRLSDEYTQQYRDRVIKELQKRGIGCRDYFAPVHLQPFYQELGYHEGDFPVAEAAGARTIALPFHNCLAEQDVDYVVKNLKELL